LKNKTTKSHNARVSLTLSKTEYHQGVFVDYVILSAAKNLFVESHQGVFIYGASPSGSSSARLRFAAVLLNAQD